jgi:hypothetical protein
MGADHPRPQPDAWIRARKILERAVPRPLEVRLDEDEVVHVNTPSAQHAMDLTGIELPGGHRLEVVTP